jgi:hypothetical protein
MEMSIRDEIDRVILEEAKSDERKKRMMEKKRPVSQMSHKDYRSRFQKPTYFAVLIGKLLYKLNKEKPRKPVSQRRGIDGYVEHDFIEPPKITLFTIIKEDIHDLPKKFLRGGTKKKKASNNFPKSSESIEDWKEYFENDQHQWQGKI